MTPPKDPEKYKIWLDARTGVISPFKGKKHTEETKIRMRASRQKNLPTGDKNPNWKGGNVKKICLNCHCEFEAKPYPKKAFSERKFCTIKCAYEYRKTSGDLKGQKNPQWRGGISFGKYCPKFNFEFKERVRAFFGYTCQVCGHVWIEGETRLAVHHVNYEKMVCCSNIKPLFVPVCAHGCHSKTNFNRDYWEEIFTNKIMLEHNGECYVEKDSISERM